MCRTIEALQAIAISKDHIAKCAAIVVQRVQAHWHRNVARVIATEQAAQSHSGKIPHQMQEAADPYLLWLMALSDSTKSNLGRRGAVSLSQECSPTLDEEPAIPRTFLDVVSSTNILNEQDYNYAGFWQQKVTISHHHSDLSWTMFASQPDTSWVT